MSWRNLSLLLGALCAWQAWRGCQRSTPTATTPAAIDCARESRPTPTASSATERIDRATGASPGATTATPSGFSINGFKVPAWAAWLAPQPGENLLDYRDRMMPIAQAVLLPHRARVARGRDDFARLANLDAQQRAQLDAAVQDAASAIQDKIMGSLMSGDLMPAHFKPMIGVALARDVLDTIDQANRQFTATLREDQKAALVRHPFDFADYLVFSAHWEDAFGVTN